MDHFNTCSYDELTRCVEVRIEWIRECKMFLRDESNQKYKNVRMKIGILVLSYEQEISYLLKARRVLKKSGKRNWDEGLMTMRKPVEQ